jgi:hypothetical protein
MLSTAAAAAALAAAHLMAVCAVNGPVCYGVCASAQSLLYCVAALDDCASWHRACKTITL